MQTITFNYLYRDRSNYKNFGSVDFSNPKEIPIAEIEATITSNLTDSEFFVAEDWGMPTLYFDEWTEDDHNWHEFLNIEVKENEDMSLSITQLLNRIIVK